MNTELDDDNNVTISGTKSSRFFLLRRRPQLQEASSRKFLVTISVSFRHHALFPQIPQVIMFSATLVLALCFLDSALLVDAGLYVSSHLSPKNLTNKLSLQVIQPSARSKCHGGQTCIIQWLDDGIYPLLSAIGVCTVGLFTGEQVSRLLYNLSTKPLRRKRTCSNSSRGCHL